MGTSGEKTAQHPGGDRPAQRGWHPGDELTPLEEQIVADAATGNLVARGEGPFGLAEMQGWGEERTIRAGVVRHLLAGGQWPVDAKGIRLRGVRIGGLLDLEGAVISCSLSLSQCYFDASGPVRLDYATAKRIVLTGCRLSGVTGQMLTATELDLSSSTLTGPLSLPGARIAGQLLCSGTKVTGADGDGYALTANALKASDVVLDGGFEAAGAVFLWGAEITGVLLCSGARLTGRDGDGNALAADRLKATDVFLHEGFAAAGAVRLAGAEITGQLTCQGAQLNGDERGRAMFADHVKVGGHAFLSEGFTANGAIRLQRAEITGLLSLNSAQLTGTENGNALVGDAMTVGGTVYLGQGFTAAGAVHLAGANITGRLTCSGAQLTGTDGDGDALVADGMKAGDGVYLDGGFTAAGTVRLARADIIGELGLRGAHLTGQDSRGNALVAGGIKVSGTVWLDQGFTATGTVSFHSARLGGSVVLAPAEPAGARETTFTFTATRAQITGALRWAPAGQVTGRVNLEGATAGELEDDWSGDRTNGYWPTGGQLSLKGFTYDRLTSDRPVDVTQRLRWLRSQYEPATKDTPAAFATQPYEQLAAVCRRAGQDTAARKVAIARRADLREYGNLSRYRWFGNWLLDKTIRYGYQTWRAGVGLAAVFVAVWVLSALAQQHHLMVPVGDIEGLHPVPSATQCTSSYPCFYPAGYAIDTVIPLITVHQAQYWGPNGHVPWGKAWVVGTWIATGLGWTLATLLVAGYTGLVRHD